MQYQIILYHYYFFQLKIVPFVSSFAYQLYTFIYRRRLWKATAS